ncbi:PepSY domain-containing protein [Halioglobus maricola]|uniref:PepSY domain-containing protein n=1 Tax=Halioglobus maricola TaxID=2601894 RepID=A0A5P9NPY4_9GAMM|nr:PepSY-associated TM helix domain-containing protein [Halioglobus maricola]QFU77354.1 PepSY domain-containing protein [Halioglobus maricola]
MQLNPELVKRSLDAHSAIGLVAGVLMYFICLTGTLAALAEGFERWEQPAIPEFQRMEPAAIEKAMNTFRSEVDEQPESLWVVLPTEQIPRTHVAGSDKEFWTDAGGNLLAPPTENWTHMLRELHLSLHLPRNIGLVVVSAAGAMLVALIISGLFAHPRLFKDAFKLRLGGSRRLEQADIHNRLSVWGLPFHLMIAVTGAFYGLVGIMVYSAAAAWYDGDADAMFDAVYGADPVIEAPLVPLQPIRAMAQLEQHHPDADPIYIVAHKVGTEAQFMEIAATQPGRLAYSEIYRFDVQGNYLGDQGLTSGPGGRQFLYSLYRIHFGYFGGWPTRIAWLALGLMLTIVSVTGVNIWLAKRGIDDWIPRAWTTFVWGAPLALAASAAGAVLLAIPALPLFLAVLVVAVLTACRGTGVSTLASELQWCTAAVLIVLAVAHLALHAPGENGAYLWAMNGGVFAAGLVMAALAYLGGRQSVRRTTTHL